jgi:hypothetical protein
MLRRQEGFRVNEAEGRAHFNFLMTLAIRREEAFGPLAMAFIRDHDLDALGLTHGEQVNLYLATAQAFPGEPRRHPHKLQYLKRARAALAQTAASDPGLLRDLDQEIARTAAELDIYTQTMKPAAAPAGGEATRQRLIVECDLPEYFLATAPRRAADYYRTRYAVSDQERIGLNFKGPTRRFQPDNPVLHKDLAGACAPFMDVRMSAFHLMLPFDIKLSRTADAPLDAGMRVWYATPGYSFPLSYERGVFCSWYDGEVVDVQAGDPHLVFVSVSTLREWEIGQIERPLPANLPLERALPISFLDAADALGEYIQFGCNFRIWFDAAMMGVLTEGAPDLPDYGVVGGAGLITRTYASENVEAYAAAADAPWKEGLSFNYVNIHLRLLPGVDSAVVPANTPLFAVHLVHNRSRIEIKDAHSLT